MFGASKIAEWLSLSECKLCPIPIAVHKRNLHECTHCERLMCLKCLKQHNVDVSLNLITVPRLIRK